MENKPSDIYIATYLWIGSFVSFGAGAFFLFLFEAPENAIFILLLGALIAAIGSLPVLLIYAIIICHIRRLSATYHKKMRWLAFLNLSTTLLYGFAASLLDTAFPSDTQTWLAFLKTTGCVTGVLLGCTLMAMLVNLNKLKIFFNHQINTNMESNDDQFYPAHTAPSPAAHQYKIMLKAGVTGALILVMLIPMQFIQNLVTEREQRHAEVVKEVSSKWASAQTVSGPYLVIPYVHHLNNNAAGLQSEKKNLVVLPENLSVNGTITPEERPRSIYKVLLYKTSLAIKGNFRFELPKDINANDVLFSEAKICVGINDLKGIEEKISINYNNNIIPLSPGLPVKNIDSIGLSAAIILTPEMLTQSSAFNFTVKLKGSEQLHFVPLSANSEFVLQSTWPNPSFDGNTLPNERTVTKDNFTAKWNFTQANLPFTTVLTDEHLNKNELAFGVTMVQPADQYSKTTRSVKYAILIIGLSFALFFIIELMQQKPVHFVQYVLVGLALVIFYALLLSVSEFMLFDYAYLIAGTATVLLIALYAKGHFGSWKTSGIFAAILSALYSFIFILIRLEDTALLVGSIGLFVILALIMYVSRKINWYHPGISLTD